VSSLVRWGAPQSALGAAGRPQVLLQQVSGDTTVNAVAATATATAVAPTVVTDAIITGVAAAATADAIAPGVAGGPGAVAATATATALAPAFSFSLAGATATGDATARAPTVVTDQNITGVAATATAAAVAPGVAGGPGAPAATATAAALPPAFSFSLTAVAATATADATAPAVSSGGDAIISGVAATATATALAPAFSFSLTSVAATATAAAGTPSVTSGLSTGNIVQENSGNTGTGTPTTTDASLASGTTAGNTLLILVSCDATVATPSVFTKAREQGNYSGHFLFRKPATAGETTWTLTPSVGASLSWYALEHSGLASNPLDVTTSQGTSSGVSSQSTGTTATTAQADVLVLASIGTSIGSGGTNSVSSWSNSFAERADTVTTKPSGANVGVAAAVLYPAAVGTYETTGTLAGTSQATGIIAVYKAGSGDTTVAAVAATATAAGQAPLVPTVQPPAATATATAPAPAVSNSALGTGDIVQENSGTTGTGTPASVTVTLPAGTTGGNSLFIVVNADATVATPSGFTLDEDQVNNSGLYLFRKACVNGETSWVITPSTSAAVSWYALEHRGLLVTSSPYDVSASNGTGSGVGSLSTGTTATTAQADELVIAAIGISIGSGATNSVASWSNGFEERADVCTSKPSGANVGAAVALRYPNAVGTYETTATLAGISQATGLVATYKALGFGSRALVPPVAGAGAAAYAPAFSFSALLVVAAAAATADPAAQVVGESTVSGGMATATATGQPPGFSFTLPTPVARADATARPPLISLLVKNTGRVILSRPHQGGVTSSHQSAGVVVAASAAHGEVTVT